MRIGKRILNMLSIDTGGPQGAVSDVAGQGHRIAGVEENVRTMLAENRETIELLMKISVVRPEEFSRYYLSVIRRLAEFLYLAPAGRSYYQEKGGMFTLCLQSGYLAYREAGSKMFATNNDPASSRLSKHMWPYAIFVGALCYPLGKVMSELVVTGEDGSHAWQPLLEGMMDWVARHNISQIHIEWDLSKSCPNYAPYSLAMTRLVLPAEIYEYLDSTDDDILETILRVIGDPRHVEDSLAGQVIDKAMGSAITKDLIRNKGRGVKIGGMKLGYYIVDALRVHHKSKWRVNSPDCPVWNLKEGVFVWWPKVARLIIDYLREEGISGVPNDADTIADILVEEGVVLPYVRGEGQQESYWPVEIVVPNVASVRADMLKLVNRELLFSRDDFEMVAGVVGDAVLIKSNNQENPGVSDKGRGQSVNEMTQMNMPEHDMQNVPTDDMSLENMEGVPFELEPATGRVENTLTGPAGRVHPDKGDGDKPVNKGNQVEIGKNRERATHKSSINFKIYGMAGQTIESIAEDIESGKWKPGEDVFWCDGGLCLRAPNVTGDYGIKSERVIEELKSLCWLDSGNRGQLYKNIKIKNKNARFIVLKHEIGNAITEDRNISVPEYKAE